MKRAKYFIINLQLTKPIFWERCKNLPQFPRFNFPFYSKPEVIIINFLFFLARVFFVFFFCFDFFFCSLIFYSFWFFCIDWISHEIIFALFYSMGNFSNVKLKRSGWNLAFEKETPKSFCWFDHEEIQKYN